MKAVGDVHVIVEALVEVRFAVSVEIVKLCQLVTTMGENDAIDDFEAEGLVKSRGVAVPGDL